ncbi:MAG: hypothetical protein PVJ55_01345 [Anaerolineae bacterium]
MAKAEVQCYAGGSYPERPRSFLYRGEWLDVADVELREKLPGELRFRVRTADGRSFQLAYDERHDVWDVRLIRPPAGSGDAT